MRAVASIARSACTTRGGMSGGSRQTNFIVYMALRDVRKLPFCDVDSLFARNVAARRI